MRGRPPKATHLKIVQGDAGKRTGGGSGGEGGDGGSRRPAKLSVPSFVRTAAGKREFREKATLLAAQRKWSGLFKTELGRYCRAYEQYLKAQDELHKKGYTASTPSGYEQVSAWLVVARRAEDTMHRLATEMGFTVIAQIRASQAQLDLFDTAAAPAPKTAAGGDDWDNI
jgi:P27 family predicted phage terminase small subunit